MAVHTSLQPLQMEELLTLFPDAGSLLSYRGTLSGIENSTYFVDTCRGAFVLTLVETVPTSTLSSSMGLVNHLAEKGFPCSRPLRSQNHQWFSQFQGQAVVIMDRLAGQEARPDPWHCRQIGGALARLHRLGSGYAGLLDRPVRDWCHEHGAKIAGLLSHSTAGTLAEGLLQLEKIPWEQLPRGAVHGDLFPDNALFSDHHLEGLIDFYHAGREVWLYDLAVTLNAWCHQPRQQSYCPERSACLIQAYHQERLLDDREWRWLPELLKVAALRFWISRLETRHLANPSSSASTPEPQVMLKLWEQLNEGRMDLSWLEAVATSLNKDLPFAGRVT